MPANLDFANLIQPFSGDACMIVTILLASIAVLGLGYVLYGRFLSRYLELNDRGVTPACGS